MSTEEIHFGGFGRRHVEQDIAFRAKHKRARTWDEAFIGACNLWDDFPKFAGDGGVPGCRIPEGSTPESLALWWHEKPDLGAPRTGHEPTEYGNSDSYYALSAVVHMIDEDQAYSPD